VAYLPRCTEAHVTVRHLPAQLQPAQRHGCRRTYAMPVPESAGQSETAL